MELAAHLETAAVEDGLHRLVFREHLRRKTPDTISLSDPRERIEEKLGYAPNFSNRDALIRNYDWYKRHHDEFHGQSGVSHRVPWKQGILSVAKWFF